MATKAQAILLGFDDPVRQKSLVDRLWTVGLRAKGAPDVPEAHRLMDMEGPFQIAIVESEADALAELISEFRKHISRAEARVLVFGSRISAPEIAAAREAGADFALWEPCHGSELRFVVNQAAYTETRGAIRDQLRVPTQLAAFVHSGAGRKPAGVYNLSMLGAYLETPRPNGSGATILVELLMRSGSVHLDAEVVTTNVPGNLRRPNRPIGMGVRFLAPRPEQEEALRRFVDERACTYAL
ncbi:MAG: PilZ domain-containing protein [Myxococcota bacterium]